MVKERELRTVAREGLWRGGIENVWEGARGPTQPLGTILHKTACDLLLQTECDFRYLGGGCCYLRREVYRHCGVLVEGAKLERSCIRGFIAADLHALDM